MDIMHMGKNPNYLGSWDLYDVPGNKLNAVIASFRDEEVVNAGKKEVCTLCCFAGGIKPMILNITNKKTLAKLFKTKETDKMVGKRITIGIEKVKAFGGVHDALRIMAVLPAQGGAPEPEIKCEICGAVITAPAGMTVSDMVKRTKARYGKTVCMNCAVKLKNEDNKESEENVNENNENKD